MKQNIHTKLLALTLTTALALTTLTACGTSAGTADLPETPGTSARPPAPAPPFWKRAAAPWGPSS